MKVILNESGIAAADADVTEIVDVYMSQQKDIHTSNELVFLAVRAWLVRIPVDKRPKVEWFIYGKQVYLDDDMRGGEGVWDHPLMNLTDNLLVTILGW